MGAIGVSAKPYDAVLVISFGGPNGIADIRPFLANVLRGRRVSPERVEEVALHYERFGGVSPLTGLTLAQADGLADRLRRDGPDLPVYVGMRNWNPLLEDTLAEMSRAGVRRAVGFITAAHRSDSSCAQYRQNVLDARRSLFAKGLADVEVTYVEDWYAHPLFIEATARHVEAAMQRVPDGLRDEARLVFTAHSVPVSMANACRYREQLAETARLVAARVGRTDHALVYQSRSGRPEDPWLEPDGHVFARSEHARGVRALVVSPIGFLCDHIEVLFDLDEQLRETCDGLGLVMERASAVNDAPLFIDMMADVVRRHAARRRLVIVGDPPKPPPGRPVRP